MGKKILTFDEIMNYHNPLNLDVFNEIVKILNKDSKEDLTPFVGAGLSAFVYPGWQGLLKELVNYITNSKSKKNIKSLIKDDKLEDAAQEIENILGKTGIHDNLKTIFSSDILEKKSAEIYKQAVYILPYLFENKVITTNYDMIIETVYQNHNLLFRHRLSPGNPSLLNQTMAQGNVKHAIYKAHGEINDDTIDNEAIVFTKRSYDEKYASDSDLVNELKKLYSGNKMFFLGCSLEDDRTLDILEKVVEQGNTHFAIISCKKNKIDERIRELREKYKLKVIVYPEKHHESVRIILEELLKKTNRFKYESLGWYLNSNHYLTFEKSVFDLFAYDADIFSFVGRKNELKELKRFCNSSGLVKWWAIIGAGATGKSRLAYQFSKELINDSKWQVKKLGQNDYDRLREISNNCYRNTLFIADYVQGHIKQITRWLESLVENHREGLIRVLLIERDNEMNNDTKEISNISWLDLMYLYANDERKINKSCYNDKFIKLTVLSDNDLKGIMDNYAGYFNKILDDETKELLLKTLENIDKDLKRPLYAQIIVHTWINNNNKNPLKWKREEILDQIVAKEKTIYKSKIKDTLSGELNLYLKNIADKIKIMATVFGDIKFEEIKIFYPNIFNEVKEFINNIKYDNKNQNQSFEDFLVKIEFMDKENKIIEALRPDLLGEYFVYDAIMKDCDNNLELLFFKDWYNEIRIIEFLNRLILDYNDLIITNDSFINNCLLIEINDNINYPTYLSILFVNLGYYSNNIDLSKKCVKQLESLHKNFSDSEQITEDLSLALANITFDQNPKVIEETVKEIRELREANPSSVRIAENLSLALANLTAKQDLKGREGTVKEIRELREANPSGVGIAETLSQVLVNLTVKQNLKERQKTVKEIEELKNQYLNSETIKKALNYAKDFLKS